MKMRSKKTELVGRAMAGAIAGVMARFAMNRFHRLWSKRKLAHYAMSALAGVLYEGLTSARPGVTTARGVPYGAAVWLGADETLAPLLHLSPPPWRRPLKDHVRGLVAHMVYGATLDLQLRVLRRLASR